MRVSSIQPTILKNHTQVKVSRSTNLLNDPVGTTKPEPIQAPSFKGSGKGAFTGFVSGVVTSVAVIGGAAIAGTVMLPAIIGGAVILGVGVAGAALGDKIENKVTKRKEDSQ